MDNNKAKFFDMLSSITEVAKVQNNEITQEEVKQLFGDLELSKEQYEHVFAYLAASGINVDGIATENNEYVKEYQKSKAVEDVVEEEEENITLESDFESEDGYEDRVEAMEGNIYKDDVKGKNKIELLQEEKDSMYLKMYLEDISAIKAFDEGEETKLFHQVKSGDDRTTVRLIEGYLAYVVEVAKQYTYSGLLVEDLIGEGNIGLMSGVASLSNLASVDDMREHIEQSIRSAILNLIDEVVDLDELQRRIIERANYLNSTSNELAEDMGRSPNLEELSEYTKISIQDIKDILHVSGDNIKVSLTHNQGKNDMK